jgi:hypothetical protein
MNQLIRLASILSVVAFGACGSSSSSPGSVSGTIHGATFSIVDAVSVSASMTDPMTGATSTEAFVLMSTTPHLCMDLAANRQHPSEKVFSIQMADINGTTISTPTAPGTFTVFTGTTPPPKAAIIGAVVTDATCMSITASGAAGASGTVTLASISGNTFDGKFDVNLDSGDHVTGSFSPEDCPALQTALTSTAMPTCM